MTLVWLMTLRSEIPASLVKTSYCTPSAKNASSLLSLRFSNGNTEMILSCLAALDVDSAIADWERSDRKMTKDVEPSATILESVKVTKASAAQESPTQDY